MSSLNAIFACKMYKASKNKEKIKSAINDPINAELVQQLSTYLDGEKIPEEYIDSLDDKKEDNTADSTSDSGNSNSPSTSAEPATFISPSDDANDADDTIDDTDSDTVDEETTDSIDDTPVEESTRIDGQFIQSNSNLFSSNITDIGKLSDIVTEVKGILNSRSDTCGVSRVLIKDNELWVHYNDKINLNNVMGTAIELLNASCYTYLEFNRLARTDNAIVFEISLSDTANQVNSVDNDKK